MRNSELIDKLNKQLEEIKSTNDLDIVYNYCQKLYCFICEHNLDKNYRKRVDDFNKFRQTKEYKECVKSLLEDIQNLINIEPLRTEYNLYLVDKDLEDFCAIPFYPNLIKIFFNMYSQFNDGLIKSYELIMGVLNYAKESNLYDLENIFDTPRIKTDIQNWNIHFSNDVDYFLFDNFFNNPQFQDNYIDTMDCEFGIFVFMTDSSFFKMVVTDYNILKIIATKIINDTIENISYNNSKVTCSISTKLDTKLTRKEEILKQLISDKMGDDNTCILKVDEIIEQLKITNNRKKNIKQLKRCANNYISNIRQKCNFKCEYDRNSEAYIIRI